MKTGKTAHNALDLIGQRFGRLTVTEKLPQRIYGNCVGWRCKCACGAGVVSTTGNLRSGNTLSCGCHRIDQSRANGAKYATKHGHFKHPLYYTWVDMLRRCGDPTRKDWRIYGARGIKVCERWATDFLAFAADMGPRPPRHSLDRIDNDGPYSPENCRWATPSQQTSNTRRARRIEAFGQTKSLKEWAEYCGVRPCLLHQRIFRDGLTPEQAIEKSRRH